MVLCCARKAPSLDTPRERCAMRACTKRLQHIALWCRGKISAKTGEWHTRVDGMLFHSLLSLCTHPPPTPLLAQQMRLVAVLRGERRRLARGVAVLGEVVRGHAVGAACSSRQRSAVALRLVSVGVATQEALSMQRLQQRHSVSVCWSPSQFLTTLRVPCSLEPQCPRHADTRHKPEF